MTIPAQNFYRIEGNFSPGFCQVLNLRLPHGWDERAGGYQAGATLVAKSRPCATWTIRHYLWLSSHFDDWQAWAAKYFDKDAVGQLAGNASSGKALNIDHPFLSHKPWNLGPCVVLEVHGYVKSPTGLYSVDVDFKQWRKPVPIQSKPAAAIPAAAKTQPTVQDALDAALADQQAQLKKNKLRDAQTP